MQPDLDGRTVRGVQSTHKVLRERFRGLSTDFLKTRSPRFADRRERARRGRPVHGPSSSLYDAHTTRFPALNNIYLAHIRVGVADEVR